MSGHGRLAVYEGESPLICCLFAVLRRVVAVFGSQCSLLGRLFAVPRGLLAIARGPHDDLSAGVDDLTSRTFAHDSFLTVDHPREHPAPDGARRASYLRQGSFTTPTPRHPARFWREYVQTIARAEHASRLKD